MLHHEVGKSEQNDNLLLSLNHTVPDYLRTKLDLDLEAKQRDLYETASLQPVEEAVSDCIVRQYELVFIGAGCKTF